MKDFQSIENLIQESKGGVSLDDDTAGGMLAKKQRQIKIKEMEKATKRMASAMGLPYIDLFGFPLSPEAISLISEEDSKKLKTISFFYDGKQIRFATTNPDNENLGPFLDKIAKEKHAEASLYLISEHSFQYAIDFYKNLPKVKEVSRAIDITEEELNRFSENFSSFRDLQKQLEEANISDIIAIIMASSIKSGSSDIHIEAEEEDIKVRFRIDGILHDVASIDKKLWKKIISRLKVLARVKINISDKPQDGRISINTKKERIDIRVSFLPTNFGESVVMRLLRSGSVGLAFEELGIRGKSYEVLKREVERPNGMIITTGPTGSGKTTTLYAILKKLNTQDTKIITIEDPIEYQLKGINQSQTSEKYTFAQGLRSIVRQDPDVVMVGEIRDLETAEIAIQAALTGHLVLSTIHTNDAAGTVPRFLSMGAKPFLLAPALNAMIGQRLVRRVCSHCKKIDIPNEEHLERAKKILEGLPENEKKNVDFDNLIFYKGEGCDACQNIGYKGRIGIYEIISVNEDVEKAILGGKASEYDMRRLAHKAGMVSMVEDGILKALDGITSLEEVFRVAEEK